MDVQRSAVVSRQFFAPIGRFALHFLEMCGVMCMGAALLSIAFFQGAALLGYPSFLEQFPEVSTAVIALNLSLPMAAWMRFRGHGWRPTLEMSTPTMLAGGLLILGFWLDAIPQDSLLFWQLKSACPLMLVVMLFRFELYSGRSGHHMH